VLAEFNSDFKERRDFSSLDDFGVDVIIKIVQRSSDSFNNSGDDDFVDIVNVVSPNFGLFVSLSGLVNFLDESVDLLTFLSDGIFFILDVGFVVRSEIINRHGLVFPFKQRLVKVVEDVFDLFKITLHLLDDCVDSLDDFLSLSDEFINVGAVPSQGIDTRSEGFVHLFNAVDDQRFFNWM